MGSVGPVGRVCWGTGAGGGWSVCRSCVHTWGEWGECHRGAAPSVGMSGRCAGRQRPHTWLLHQARARRCRQGVVGVQLQAQTLQE